MAVALLSGAFALVVDVLGLPGSTGWIAVLLSLSLLAGIALFVRPRSELMGGALTLLAACAGAWLEAARIGAGEHHAKFLPFVALTGWLGARLLRRPDLARDAAAGMVGAAYFTSGLSKLMGSGLGFARGSTVALLMAERAEPGTLLGSVREALVQSPVLMASFAGGALLIELCGLAMIVPRLRGGYAVLAILLHTGIAVAMGYVYFPWALTVVAVAWSASRREVGPVTRGQ